MSTVTLHTGDSRQILRTLPENSVDAIVTDPPYGLEFMGNEWDAPWKSAGAGFSKPGIGERAIKWPSFSSTKAYGNSNPTCSVCGGRARGEKKCECETPQWKPIGKRRNPDNEGLPSDVTSSGMASQMKLLQEWNQAWATECLRILKPGGHLLAFSGSRTYHRLAAAVEDAGFEIRDQIMWVYGSGFPKSHNISKALDKMAGEEPEIVGVSPNWRESKRNREQFGSMEVRGENAGLITKPSSDEAKKWEGWGTALKPSHEPIVVARKPVEGTVAENIRKWGVGGLNIDGCRVEFESEEDKKESTEKNQHADFDSTMGGNQVYGDYSMLKPQNYNPPGRWPANLMHDGSQEVLDLFPETGKSQGGRSGNSKAYEGGFKMEHYGDKKPGFFDSGSAARFFYCPKASKRDRNEGCENIESKPFTTSQPYGEGAEARAEGNARGNPNNHPTVKPTELMRYLCRLVTPPGGTVLDPFLGSGSTGKAAVIEGFSFIGIDLSPEYTAIAKARINHALANR